MLGYYAANGNNKRAEELFRELGDKCGYIFQLMNDMEAFCSKEKIVAHKGAYNNDFEKNRKNIVISYMFDLISRSEKEKVLNATGQEQEKLLNYYFSLYKFKDSLINEIETIYSSILDNIDELTAINNNYEWKEIFSFFIKTVTDTCKGRLDV